MSGEYEKAYEELSPIQRDAVDWGDGAALILAGPGAGKTRVLTTRIAKLLRESSTRKFRILALTFTSKAAGEMRERVVNLLPDVAEDRTFIGTFHSFCAQILGQHGSHIEIQSDFGICDQPGDRHALLAEAIQEAMQKGEAFSDRDVELLDTIDRLKASVIAPEKAFKQKLAPHLIDVYKLYEEKLRSENVMDFNGLILESCKLLATKPAIAERIRSTYPYWMIDEFQDTSPAQWWLLHYLSGDSFRNVFAVADEDQIIYQWAGASYRQIEKFRDHYRPVLIQLVENHRCPPEIVTIANRLVAHNTQRVPEKEPTKAARQKPLGILSVHAFGTDVEEREYLTDEMLSVHNGSLGGVAILGRSRTILEPLMSHLKANGVNATLLQRRDTFISPQFIWLQACFDQVLRPLDKRVFALCSNAANKFIGVEFDPLLQIVQASGAGHTFLEQWAANASASDSATAQALGKLVSELTYSKFKWKDFLKKAIPIILQTVPISDGAVSDTAEDHAAWKSLLRDIQSEKGGQLELTDVVQGLALRSKEPPRDPGAVAVMTIHGAKGLEFEHVYVVGLAEQEIPSWQSVKAGDTAPQMEEERRNCFVAITRTKGTLCLSWAAKYRGYDRKPSRFLNEMMLLND